MTGLAERLAAAPAAVAAAAAGEGWIVGGAIRDAALGRSVIDADLAVAPGREQAAARAIARHGEGLCFPLSEEFGTWRAIAGDRAWQVDVTRLRAKDLDADLRLRDFTINAVALPAAEPAGEPIDPFDGLGDLERRVLRAVSPRSFADDPLRLLRAARLASELELAIDPLTAALAREAAPKATEPAAERRLAELCAIVAGSHPIRAVELLDELEATAAVLPELDALRGVEQNPNHHLDVHGHTIEVLRQVLTLESDLEAYAGASAGGVRDLLAEPLGDGFTRGAGLRLAALMHDIGKPATKGERNGYVTFIGHDSVGADMVARALDRLQASTKLVRYVEGITRHHLHLGFMVHERPLTRRRIYEYLALCGDVAPDVTLLTAADRMSARGAGPIASPEMIEAHLELVREILPAALAWHREGPPAIPIRGDELAAELGIEPGPRLGELIEEVRAAIYAGEITGRGAAVEHARRALAAGGRRAID